MTEHQNRLEINVIEDHGATADAAGIRVRGETKDLVFTNNIIRDSRPPDAHNQTVGIRIEEPAGRIGLESNDNEAKTPI